MNCCIARKVTLIATCVAAIFVSIRATRGAQRAATSQASQLADLTDQLRIGAEFFLNRTETRESVRRQFHLMQENGLTLVRIFVIWDDIERAPNNWNFQGYD